MFADRYTLTREQSVFLAKKKRDENIFCGMKMENRNVTFPQTQTILHGVNVGSVALDDVTAILNMRDAWRYVLSMLDRPLTLSLLCTINGYISRNESLAWGVLRTGNVGISGTAYVPPIPQEDAATEALSAIFKQEGTWTEKALNLFLWGMRSQLFWDGNKRTSLLCANHLLISTGHGMLTIREGHMADFHRLLTDFYDHGEGTALKAFLYVHALDGISFPQ